MLAPNLICMHETPKLPMIGVINQVIFTPVDIFAQIDQGLVVKSINEEEQVWLLIGE